MLTATASPTVVLPPVLIDPSLNATIQTIPEAAPCWSQGLRLELGAYVARLALTEEERRQTYRLRFMVFNLELNEGLPSAYLDGYDKDRFDDVCDHLIVEERATGEIVGTYRIQMGDVAGRNFGITASRSSVLLRMRRCARRSSSWAARASAALIARRRCCTCCGGGSHGMR